MKSVSFSSRLRHVGTAVLAAVLAASVSCIPRSNQNESRASQEESKGSGVQSRLPPDPGVKMSPDSSNLARSGAGPLFYLDKAAGRLLQSPKEVVEVTSAGNVDFEGWAVDEVAKASAGGVNIVIEGTHYPAYYGIVRLDVLNVFKVPDYAYSGFVCSIPVAKIGPGRHRVAVQVISKDGKTVYEAWPVTLKVG